MAGIAFVETLAFGRNDRNDEAELVDRLRAEGAVIASLVAEASGILAGPAFMAMELRPGALRDTTGAVRYAASFGLNGVGLERSC